MSGKMLLKLLGLALVVLAPLPAGASKDADLKAYVRSIDRLYADLEYERALGQIANARSLSGTVEDDVMLSLYEGVILGEMSRWDESAAAFKAALYLRPMSKLPVKVSPKVEKHFEAVRKEIQQELANQAPAAPSPGPQRPPLPDKPAVTPLADSAIPRAPPSEARQGLSRPRVLIPAIGGGALLIAGGTSWALSRRELSRLRRNDPGISSLEELRGTASRGRTLQTVGVGLLGVGIAGLGVATGFYVFEARSNKVSLEVSTDGRSALVQGRWP